MKATKLATERWSQQHKNFTGDWADHYWKTQGEESRGKVIEALSEFPWGSLVELGCNAGPMLQNILDVWPHNDIAGIECNEVAVRAAQKHKLQVVKADLMTWLPSCPSKEWDVVLTHYTLAYVDPEDIKSVLSQMLRIAKIAVVLAEPTGDSRMLYAYPEWAHPYPSLMVRLGAKRVDQIEVSPPNGHLNRVTVAHVL